MKTITKKQSLDASMREILLAMSVDSVEHYHIGNMNHGTMKNSYTRVRKQLQEDKLGEWIHKYDDELFIIARIK